MADIRKGDGYGEDRAGPTGGGPYASTPKDKKWRRPATSGAPAAAAYGAGAGAGTTYYGSDAGKHRRFPWAVLAILCILAVLLVIGLVKYGVKDTDPIAYPKPPTVPTTVYVPPPPDVTYPLARAG